MKLSMFFILCFVYVDAVIYKLEEWQSELMPPIITLDPYSSCLQHPDGMYCSGFLAYVVDEPTERFTIMQEYSAHTPTHFNYTRALFGVCISEKCKDFYHDENNIARDPKRVLEACLNHTQWEKYNLKVRVEDDFSCHGHIENVQEISATDKLMLTIVVVLVLLNVVGSLFDVYCTKQHDWPGAIFLLFFSIRQNLKKLMAPIVVTDPKLKAFIGLNGIRGILSIAVVVAHAMLIVYYCENPGFVESVYTTSIFPLLLNGPIFMQVYLFISGLLLIYFLQLYAEIHEITWKVLPLVALKRWLRLTPTYALVIGGVMTWHERAGSGPLWDILITPESTDCRRDWWKHLLYLNNYVDDSTCMLHTWYYRLYNLLLTAQPVWMSIVALSVNSVRPLWHDLSTKRMIYFIIKYIAADTQLYLLGTIIFIICHKSKFRNVILSSMLIIGMIIPALHTYFQDLDGSLILSPSTALTMFKHNRTFHETYKRGHTNLPCYIIGMACGYLTFYLQRSNINLNKYKKWSPVCWLTLPAALAFCMYCKVMFEDGARPALLYRVLAAAFIKTIFGILAIINILGMLFKLDADAYRAVFEWHGWRVVGRLSYGMFLLHLHVVKAAMGVQTAPVLVTYTYIAQFVVIMLVKSLLAATVFWVTVENPLAQVVKHLIIPDSMKLNIQQEIKDSEKNYTNGSETNITDDKQDQKTGDRNNNNGVRNIGKNDYTAKKQITKKNLELDEEEKIFESNYMNGILKKAM